jgi:prepilin-type N-terminal cleavage/methylation domain-containing protein/prepilin-type processing-associated H-X9-DG protein
MKKTHPSSVAPRSCGFTLIEMLVVIAIIVLLASLVVPAVSKSLTRAKEIKKMTNLRSMFTANTIYMLDNNGFMVPATDESDNDNNWRGIMGEYLAREDISIIEANKERIFIDPFFEQYDPSVGHSTGYGINYNPGLPDVPTRNVKQVSGSNPNQGRSFYMDEITYPSSRILIGDVVAGRWFMSKNQPAIDTTRHKGKGMFLFFDGGIRKLDQEQAELALLDPAKVVF